MFHSSRTPSSDNSLSWLVIFIRPPSDRSSVVNIRRLSVVDLPRYLVRMSDFLRYPPRAFGLIVYETPGRLRHPCGTSLTLTVLVRVPRTAGLLHSGLAGVPAYIFVMTTVLFFSAGYPRN